MYRSQFHIVSYTVALKFISLSFLLPCLNYYPTQFLAQGRKLVVGVQDYEEVILCTFKGYRQDLMIPFFLGTLLLLDISPYEACSLQGQLQNKPSCVWENALQEVKLLYCHAQETDRSTFSLKSSYQDFIDTKRNKSFLMFQACLFSYEILYC